MAVTMIHRAGLRVTSKSTALDFYKGIRRPILIPYDDKCLFRIEPGRLFGIVDKDSISKDTAWAYPNVYDFDGAMAYKYRKYINAYLASELTKGLTASGQDVAPPDNQNRIAGSRNIERRHHEQPRL